MTGPEYLYPNAATVAASRLRGLEAIEDAATIEVLNRLGDLSGKRCLEVGAGAGSIARWLAARVGPTGSVLATDLDSRLLEPLAGGNLHVQTHDILRDPLPEAAFDLIHVRHVLIHLNERAPEAFRRLSRALKSGGTLVCEESDFAGASAMPQTPPALAIAHDRAVQALLKLYRKRGMAVHLGARLATLARESHLSIEHTATSSREVTGGSDEALYQQATLRQAAEALVAGGQIDAPGVEAAVAALADPRLTYRARATVRVVAKQG